MFNGFTFSCFNNEKNWTAVECDQKNDIDHISEFLYTSLRRKVQTEKVNKLE